MPKRDLERHPPIPCWFCGRKLSALRVARDGILLAREESRGGPQRLYICPSCLKENLCEETRRGRWFASPNVSLGILDILFSQLPGAATEEVLSAVSWYRENEERRRFYFEADGDGRYQGMGKTFLRKLWPWSAEGGAAREGAAREGAARRREASAGGSRAGEGARASSQGGASRWEGRARRAGSGPRPRPRAAPAPERPRLVTPYEILGLSPEASPNEIRKAFHRLAVQYHPDKVYHLGEEFQAMAHLKFQELKRAYDVLTGEGRPRPRKS